MSVGARKRKLGTLTRADLGKQVTFTCECVNNSRPVEGSLRSFSHGLFSHESEGVSDAALVGITVRTHRSHETHWATPETIGRLTV